MKRSFRINTAAQRDIVRIGRYLADVNATVAHRFLQAVRASCERLQRSPDLGETWPGSPDSSWEFRCWCVRGFSQYVIFYRDLADSVEIVRLLHSAQDADAEL